VKERLGPIGETHDGETGEQHAHGV
jgi:hypothetical protein